MHNGSSLSEVDLWSIERQLNTNISVPTGQVGICRLGRERESLLYNYILWTSDDGRNTPLKTGASLFGARPGYHPGVWEHHQDLLSPPHQ